MNHGDYQYRDGTEGTPLIEARHIEKRYGAHTAVSNLSFTAETGSVYGLLGPNGAGKSTTLNILAGCLAPSGGQALLDGHDVFDEPAAAKRTLGYLPEQPPLYPEMTPGEYLAFIAKLRGVPRGERAAEIARVMELTEITDVRDRLIRNLSKGYRQRVGMAQALLGDPRNILLDEPSAGLDPKQIAAMRALIRSLAGEHTVVLSSHILSEVQAVCDHILILHNGVLRASGTPAQLESSAQGGVTLRLSVKGALDDVSRALKRVAGKDNYTAREEGGLIRATMTVRDGDAAREKAFFAFGERKLPIVELTAETTSLEDVFLRCTDGEGGAER